MFAAHRTTGAETQHATELQNLRQRHPGIPAGAQEFQNHLDSTGGINTEPHTTSGSHDVSSNNAYLNSSTNTGLFDVHTNKAELHTNANAGHFSVDENKGNLHTFGNRDQVSVGTNRFKMSSTDNHGIESVEHNKYSADVTDTDGNNNFVRNTGKVNVNRIKPGGQVHFDSQSGTVQHELEPSMLPEMIRPSKVTHKATGKPLTLDQYGSHNLSNVTGNLQRAPVTAVSGYSLAALNTLAVPLGVGINNWAAAPVSIDAAKKLHHPKAD